MTKLIVTILMIALSTSTFFAQTQMEMNQVEHDEFKKAEMIREKTILQIKTLYADNPEFLLALSASEKKWEEYRDAFLEMIFPGEDKMLLYGSMYSMVYNQQEGTNNATT